MKTFSTINTVDHVAEHIIGLIISDLSHKPDVYCVNKLGLEIL